MKTPQRKALPETLDELIPGEIGRIAYIEEGTPLYGRLEDMGIHTGAYIRCERVSLFGDPVAYRTLRPVQGLVRPPRAIPKAPSEDSRSDGQSKGQTVGRADKEPPSEPPMTFADEALIAIRRKDAQAVHIAPYSLSEASEYKAPPLVAMVGNPNVGKSSLFNALTGLRRHTGNWTGKTVDCAIGECRRRRKHGRGGRGSTESPHPQRPVLVADLPGCYSLDPHSPEEDEARRFLLTAPVAAVVVVCEAKTLARNLPLAFQINSLPNKIPVILCVNLMDEAEKQGISVDADALSEATGLPVLLTSAKRGEGLDALSDLMEAISYRDRDTCQTADGLIHGTDTSDEPTFIEIAPAASYREIADRITAQCLHNDPAISRKKTRYEHFLDTVLTGRITAVPIAIILLAMTFWLTVEGSNLPSSWLSRGFARLGEQLSLLKVWSYLPPWVSGILLDGVYATLTRVIAVMLPPMAIFFPLFTLLEDFGLLPRIAFNFDRCYRSCHACGKQALTTCMSFGCNAVGVTGCRIIDSPRERLIGIFTASFVPCNGKFPTLIALCTILVTQNGGSVGKYHSLWASLLLTALVVLSVLITLPLSRLLSATVLRGQASGFVMEMPPFRVPHVGRVLMRSLLDRTLFVLGRAVIIAAPAGAVLWLFSTVTVGDASLIAYLTAFLDPIGLLLCVDGAVLLALILSMPANELTLPILLMIYSAGGSFVDHGTTAALGAQFAAVGWTTVTAIAFTVLFLFHAPCTTTLLTIRKETKSWKWVLLAAVLPCAVGITICLLLKCCLAVK